MNEETQKIPSYDELYNTDILDESWILSEDYENYTLASILSIINDRVYSFYDTLKQLNEYKKSLLYSYKEIPEHFTSKELISKIKEVNDTCKIKITNVLDTENIVSINISFDNKVNLSTFEMHLKVKMDKEFNRIDNLITAIRQAIKYNVVELCLHN